MRHFEEAKGIWKSFVPQSGQADTVQGELLRAVEKLRREALDNGNANWDRGFEILLQYLRDRLLDPQVFGADAIAQTTEVLDALADVEMPITEDGPFDDLCDRVVEYYRHRGSQPHPHNTALQR